MKAPMGSNGALYFLTSDGHVVMRRATEPYNTVLGYSKDRFAIVHDGHVLFNNHRDNHLYSVAVTP